MKADADAVIDAFGKNKQVKKVFRTLFVAMAGWCRLGLAIRLRRSKWFGLLRGWRGVSLRFSPRLTSFILF